MKENRKVSLRTLAAHLCVRWKILLLAAILCGGAAGAYRMYKLWPETQVTKKETETKAEPTEKEKRTTSFYEEELKRINSQISTRQEYIADSIYTQIDFSKVGLASVDFYVFLDTDLHPELMLQSQAAAAAADTVTAAAGTATAEDGTVTAAAGTVTAEDGAAAADTALAEEEIAAEEEIVTEEDGAVTDEEGAVTDEEGFVTEDGSTASEDDAAAGEEAVALTLTTGQNNRRRRLALRAYSRFVNNMIDWTELAEKFNTEPRYLQELVVVTSMKEDLGCMLISVKYTDPEGADEILQYVIDQMEKYPHSEIEEAGSFEIRFKNRASRWHADVSKYKVLNSRVSELNTLMQTKDSFQTNINKNRASVKTNTSSTAARSKKSVLKQGIKYGAAGFAAGICACAALIIIALISRTAVLSGRELNDTYGFRKIAVIPMKDIGSLKGFSRLAAAADSSYRSSRNMEDGLKVANVNLRNMTEDGERIGLIGDCGAEKLEELAGRLSGLGGDSGSYSVRAISNLNGDASALEALEECSSVVIAAEVPKSTYRNTDDLLATVDAYGKTVAGSIVLC